MTAIAADVAGLLRPRVRLDLVEWITQYRMITDGPAVAGEPIRWDWALDPLSRAPLDAIQNPRWTQVVEMASPQASGKTSRAVSAILWSLHECGDDVLYYSSSEMLARDLWESKIKPAMEQSPGLAAMMPTYRDDVGRRGMRRFTNGTNLYVRGADSRGALSGVSVRMTVGDDVQAMTRFPEGDHPVDVAQERAGALARRQVRHVVLGQPGMADDYLSRALFASAFYVPVIACPACGAWQLIEWDRMEYPPDAIAAATDTRLRCAACDERIAASRARALLKSAKWISTPPGENWILNPPAGGTVVDLADVAEYPETQRRTTIAGFWRPATYWGFIPWGDLAGLAVESVGNPDRQMNFEKRILARPWQSDEAQADRSAAAIAAHVTPTARWGQVGQDDAVVILTVDVQGGFVYWLARAWDRATGTSALIAAGSTKEIHATANLPGGLETVALLAAGGWPGPSGRALRPVRCLIDSKFQPETVWRHCVRHDLALWLPIQGDGRAREIWPAAPRRVGMRHYWPVAVNEAKSVLTRLLDLTPGQPGYSALPGDTPPRTLKAYQRHMTAEIWDDDQKRWVRRRGYVWDDLAEKWRPKRPGEKGGGAGRNDYWDLETYQVAGAVGLGVRLPVYDDGPPAPAAGFHDRRTRSGAFHNRRKKVTR